MSQQAKMPFEVILREDGVLEIIDDRYKPPSPTEQAERKRNSARCGHIKRRLVRHEPLKGGLLEFALDIVGKDNEIAQKLKSGQPLSDYELHIMLDVYLVSQRVCF